MLDLHLTFENALLIALGRCFRQEAADNVDKGTMSMLGLCQAHICRRGFVPVYTPRRRSLVALCRAASEGTKQKRLTHNDTASGAQQHEAEAYRAATDRLQTLLTDAALSNKDVVPMDFLDACSIEERLTLFTNVGTLLILAAMIFCWVFESYDPLGGIAFDHQTLDAALLGAGYALPLALCSVAARTQLFRESFPVLEEMHDNQQETLDHIIGGMNLPQISIFLLFVVFPSIMLLLPATTAAVNWAGHFGQQALLQTWAGGLHIRPLQLGPLGRAIPPVISGYLAGGISALCFNVRPKVIELMRDAVRSADSYFRLTHTQQPPTQQSGRQPAAPPPQISGPPVVFATTSYVESVFDSTEEEELVPSSSSSAMAADAFRNVAMLWLISRRRVARLSYILTAVTVAYLGVIWQATGNLATPMTAAFLHAAAELLMGEQQHQSKQRQLPTSIRQAKGKSKDEQQL